MSAEAEDLRVELDRRRVLSELGGALGGVRTLPLYSGQGAKNYAAAAERDSSELTAFLRLAHSLPARARVLDLACGSGRITLPLARMGLSVTGIDTSQDLLGILQSRVEAEGLTSAVRVVEDDIRSWISGEAFDLVILGATSIGLFDAKDRTAVLASALKNARRSGMIAVSCLSGACAEPPLALFDQPVGEGDAGATSVAYALHLHARQEPFKYTGYLVCGNGGAVEELYYSKSYCVAAPELVRAMAALGCSSVHQSFLAPTRTTRSKHALLVWEGCQ